MGDINNFDSIILKACDVEVDESAINGETDMKKKIPAVNFTIDENPFLVSGTNVV